MTGFENELNPEQLAAVTAPDGPQLVLAAAGTGKTRTLVYRVAFLVGQGVAPGNILLLTFTNRAAREMLDRAAQVTGTGISGLWGGTFHHMANRILRRHARLLGYANSYTILDQDDSRTLIADAVRALGLKHKDFPRKEVLGSIFSTAANADRELDEVIDERLGDVSVDPADILRVHRRYEERKHELQAMDFDDLLLNGHRLLQEHPAVLARYRAQFRHVLVDEYQDTNPVQARIVDLLARQHRNLFVVGDDFQSIYGWRGADFRNILSFPERYPDTRIFKLETNYRSVPEILAVANTCIAGNPEQFPKTLRATRDAYRKPMVARLRDGYDQARFVIERVHDLRREGYRYGDIAVLYRAHFHTMELQMELTREHLPHRITSGVRFFEQAHVKDACTIVKLLHHPGDEMAFTRLLGLLPGVGPRTAAKCWEKLGRRFDALNAGQCATLRAGLRAQGARAWEGIEPAFSARAGARSGRDGGEMIAHFVQGFYHDHARRVYEDADRRLEDINALIAHTARCGTIEAFLSDMALLTNLDAETGEQDDSGARDGPGDVVHLSTVHQAKGLEWPVVIVLWATEGMFPSARSVRETLEGEAEERRLFYVAVTRARDELCLCVPQGRHVRDGGFMYCSPSRYVAELNTELVRTVGTDGYGPAT